MDEHWPQSVASSAEEYLERVFAGEIVARQGTKLASYLVKSGARKVSSEQRGALADNMLNMEEIELTGHERAGFIRKMQSNLNPDNGNICWSAFPIVRASISIQSWLTAVEGALKESLMLFGAKTEKTAFKSMYGAMAHRMGPEHGPKPDDVFRLVKLRHDLVHANPKVDFDLLNRGTDELVSPLEEYHSAIVEFVLESHFEVENPKKVHFIARLRSLGLPEHFAD